MLTLSLYSHSIHKNWKARAQSRPGQHATPRALQHTRGQHTNCLHSGKMRKESWRCYPWIWCVEIVRWPAAIAEEKTRTGSTPTPVHCHDPDGAQAHRRSGSEMDGCTLHTESSFSAASARRDRLYFPAPTLAVLPGTVSPTHWLVQIQCSAYRQAQASVPDSLTIVGPPASHTRTVSHIQAACRYMTSSPPPGTRTTAAHESAQSVRRDTSRWTKLAHILVPGHSPTSPFLVPGLEHDLEQLFWTANCMI